MCPSRICWATSWLARRAPDALGDDKVADTLGDVNVASMTTPSLRQRTRERLRRLAGRYDAGWAPSANDLDLGPSPVILEIGANDGTDTLALLRAYPHATMACFEPEPRAILRWRDAVRWPQVELFEVAIAAHDGVAIFHRSDFADGERASGFDDGWNMSGSLRTPTTHLERWPWVSFPETMEVATRSLDSWTYEHHVDHIDLIWADVQGAEVDLVAGGARTLRHTRYLYTEIFDEAYYEGQITLAQLIELLPGWTVVRRWENDVMLCNLDFEDSADSDLSVLADSQRCQDRQQPDAPGQ